jgi:hypothetical protein
MTATVAPRVVGLLTAAYGVYTLLRPASLVRAADLTSGSGAVPRAGQTLGRVIGARDLLSGVAMVTAPAGAPLQAAVVARVCCDVSDVVGFGLTVPPRSRAKVMAVAGAWGAIAAASWLAAGDSS